MAMNYRIPGKVLKSPDALCEQEQEDQQAIVLEALINRSHRAGCQ
jgi:hypothetical protein